MGLHLNLGCGNKYLAGYTNIDLYAKRIDVHADIRQLDYTSNSVSSILLSHVLEHLTWKESALLIQKAFTWLEPNGSLIIELPERDKCLKLVHSGVMANDQKLIVRGLKGIMGGRGNDAPGWSKWLYENIDLIVKAARLSVLKLDVPLQWCAPGEPHLYCWSDSELKSMLYTFGFKIVCVTVPHRHGVGKEVDRDCRIEGFKL